MMLMLYSPQGYPLLITTHLLHHHVSPDNLQAKRLLYEYAQDVSIYTLSTLISRLNQTETNRHYDLAGLENSSFPLAMMTNFSRGRVIICNHTRPAG